MTAILANILRPANGFGTGKGHAASVSPQRPGYPKHPHRSSVTLGEPELSTIYESAAYHTISYIKALSLLHSIFNGC